MAGITTVAAADGYLREVFVPAYNARFAVAPEQPGSAFVAVGDLDLDQILCVEEPRQWATTTPCCGAAAGYRSGLAVAAAFCPPPGQVRQHLDGTLSIFHGPRCIAPDTGRKDRPLPWPLNSARRPGSLWICG